MSTGEQFIEDQDRGAARFAIENIYPHPIYLLQAIKQKEMLYINADPFVIITEIVYERLTQLFYSDVAHSRYSVKKAIYSELKRYVSIIQSSEVTMALSFLFHSRDGGLAFLLHSGRTYC